MPVLGLFLLLSLLLYLFIGLPQQYRLCPPESLYHLSLSDIQCGRPVEPLLTLLK